MRLFSFIFLLFLSLKGVSQNYLNYYHQVDSAAYYASINNRAKAEACYKRAFSQYIGIYYDYERAIVNSYKLNKKLNIEYVTKGFESGLIFMDLKYDLKKNKIPYSRFKLKKLHRKHRIRKSVDIKPLKLLLKKDQHPRSKLSKEVHIQDSLNAVELIHLFQTQPDLFNRLKTGFHWSEMVAVLISHQHWINIEPIFYKLMGHVEKGYMNRTDLTYFLERNSVGGGYTFLLDTLANRFIATKNINDTVCLKRYHYSSLGDFSLYDFSIKNHISIPTNPLVSKKELDAKREFMFLSSMKLYQLSYPSITFFTKEEFCDFITKRAAQQKEQKK